MKLAREFETANETRRWMMSKFKRNRQSAAFEGGARSIKGGALGEAGMARRSFLGEIGRFSAALAALGLVPEAGMRVVSGRSTISSAIAAGAMRDRRFHPFPSDDPYNMPIGTNAWYASSTDPATANYRAPGGGDTMTDNGWSHPIYMPSGSDPAHSIRIWTETNDGSGVFDGWGVRSYRPDENTRSALSERLQSSAVPAIPADTSVHFGDRHLHILYENELVEMFRFDRLSLTTARAKKIVRNRLDRYSYGWSSYSEHNHPNRNEHGCRAWGGSAIAGLIRKHEIEGPNPHIPHALAVNLAGGSQLAGYQQGDPSSPLYNFAWVFPATFNDFGGHPTSRYPDPRFGRVTNGSCRMGMRFALDPTICTDAWIMANAPKLSDGSTNMVQVALARAMRDYGLIVADETADSRPIIACEHHIDHVTGQRARGWNWCGRHMLRVAGRLSNGTIVHVPTYSHWRAWADAGQGWGGGSPRVPYSPPLAPLSGEVPPPPAPPEAPGAIDVTRVRTFDAVG